VLRAEVKEALAAVHASNMLRTLQERLDVVKRVRAGPSPFLTESRMARMDKGVPRPVAQPVRPGYLRSAAPPPDVERPERVEAESELGIRIFSLTLVGFSAFPYLLVQIGSTCVK
jgi:hypothetical protein